MKVSKVVGNVWATKKEERLNGQKLLVLQPLLQSQNKNNDYLIAADIIGAGIGDIVLVAFGAAARYAVSQEFTPVDAAVIGIVDKLEVDGIGEIYEH